MRRSCAWGRRIGPSSSSWLRAAAIAVALSAIVQFVCLPTIAAEETTTTTSGPDAEMDWYITQTRPWLDPSEFDASTLPDSYDADYEDDVTIMAGPAAAGGSSSAAATSSSDSPPDEGSSEDYCTPPGGKVLCAADRLTGRIINPGKCETQSSWVSRSKANHDRLKAAGCDVDVVWYGDSIIEYWEHRDIDDWNKYMEDDGFTSVYAGIGGDTSDNLICRVQHGEYAYVRPKVVVISIGINDLIYFGAANESPDAIVKIIRNAQTNVRGIISYILQRNCDAQFIVTSVLTASADKSNFHWPNSYTAPIEAINKLYSSFAAKFSNVHFADCHQYFIVDSKDSSSSSATTPYMISEELSDDTIHPTPAGYAVLAKCVNEYVKKIMYDSKTTQSTDYATSVYRGRKLRTTAKTF